MDKPTRSKELTFGADPEFFLYRKGKFVPAYLSGITGTKDKPQKLKSGGAVQVDGMALEFNIEPQTTPNGFYKAINTALFEIRELVDPELEFRFVPEATFDAEDFKNTPDKFKELGCDPDFDAFREGVEKSPPASAANQPFRCAGGHIHVGWLNPQAWGMSQFDPHDPRHMYDCNTIVQSFEGTWSAHSKYTRRAELYGKGGSFRPKVYGLEWRRPDNTWLGYDNTNICRIIRILTTQVSHSFRQPIDLSRMNRVYYTADCDYFCDYQYSFNNRKTTETPLRLAVTSPARMVEEQRRKIVESLKSKRVVTSKPTKKKIPASPVNTWWDEKDDITAYSKKVA